MPGDEKTWAETVNTDPGAVRYNGPTITTDDPVPPAESRFVGGEDEAAALLRLLTPGR